LKTAAAILGFWFSDPVKARWFSSTPAFDAEIKATFGETANRLGQGPFPHPTWEATPDQALALIIVLDQFPRNMFRGQAAAFQWDAHALGISERMVDKGWDMDIPVNRRAFVYMPFMHAEDLSAQNRCVELTGSRLADDGGKTLEAAISHRDVIERFGRFPHRNKTLGRDSTPDEIAFLDNGGYDPS
jgi:uncharacterized protein (DUF924 family)